jgi:hypothetical protein
MNNEWWNELRDLAHQLEPWFDIDKVKSYGVYVWTKGEDLNDPDYPYGENVFDIYADRIQFYQCNHVWHLPNEAISIITKIQEKLREVNTFSKKE